MRTLTIILLSLGIALLNGETMYDIAISADTAVHAMNCEDAEYALFSSTADKAFDASHAERTLIANKADGAGRCDKAKWSHFAQYSPKAVTKIKPGIEKCEERKKSSKDGKEAEDDKAMKQYIFQMVSDFKVPCGQKKYGGNGKKCTLRGAFVNKARYAVNAKKCTYAIYAEKTTYAANTKKAKIARSAESAVFAEFSRTADKSRFAGEADAAQYAKCPSQ